MMNLLHLSNLLHTFEVHVKVCYLSTNHRENVCWGSLGRCDGLCVGSIWYDAASNHVYEFVGEKLDACIKEDNFTGLLEDFKAGGKGSKAARPKAKCTAKTTSDNKTHAKDISLANCCANIEDAIIRADLPFDPKRCCARVWNHGVGYGAQCLASPQPNTEFCKTHTSNKNLRHGRFDNPIDPVVKAMFEKAQIFFFLIVLNT